MTFLSLLQQVALTAMHERLANADTSGPRNAANAAPWSDGWWAGARRLPAHHARIGGVIAPFAEVIHTTDMHPDDWLALLKSWTTTPGAGNAAHFAIGRTASDGVVQFAPITRNANHAGGPGHGVFQAGKAVYHPNLVAVGIEVHCAGQLRYVAGHWRWGEGNPWTPHGAPIPDFEVLPDAHHPGRGWHRPTAYQLARLDELHVALQGQFASMPAGCIARSLVEQPAPWGVPRTARVVGHVSLDAARKVDPGPELMAHVNAWP